MDDALLMGVLDPLADLEKQREAVGHRQFVAVAVVVMGSPSRTPSRSTGGLPASCRRRTPWQSRGGPSARAPAARPRSGQSPGRVHPGLMTLKATWRCTGASARRATPPPCHPPELLEQTIGTDGAAGVTVGGAGVRGVGIGVGPLGGFLSHGGTSGLRVLGTTLHASGGQQAGSAPRIFGPPSSAAGRRRRVTTSARSSIGEGADFNFPSVDEEGSRTARRLVSERSFASNWSSGSVWSGGRERSGIGQRRSVLSSPCWLPSGDRERWPPQRVPLCDRRGCAPCSRQDADTNHAIVTADHRDTT